MYRLIALERRDRVAWLTLRRPEAMNALHPDLVDEMGTALEEVNADEAVKALVVTGNDKAFCAGADLKFLKSALEDQALFRTYVQRLNAVLCRLESLSLPTIAVVRGYALAGGLELLLACDYAFAAESAQIGDQHLNFALLPGAGSTQRLPRRVGLQRALYLITTGARLTGRQAQEWDLVVRAAPDNALDAEIEQTLGMLRTKSRPALGCAKRALRQGLEAPLPQGLQLETETMFAYFGVCDHARRGVQAFLDKKDIAF